jgi:hypothetical protein
MTENWVMLSIGVLLIIFGLAMTAVSGPMPGAQPLYPTAASTSIDVDLIRRFDVCSWTAGSLSLELG